MWLRPECEILIGVEALMAAHHAPARGEICVLHAGPDLYIVSFTFSAIGTQWSWTVKTKWSNQRFKPVARDGKDGAHPNYRRGGELRVSSATRGYRAYSSISG